MIRTGIGGWVYPDWRKGMFYPEGLAQKRELEWASRQLGAIEIPFHDFSHIDANPFFAPNAEIVPELEAYMDELRKSGGEGYFYCFAAR